MLPASLGEHFEHQAKACASLGSPFTAKLCRLLIDVLDETTSTGRRVLGWPGDPRADALALRMCGGLHRLVLTGADEALRGAYPPKGVADERLTQAVARAISVHDGLLHGWLDSPPQTNEIARSGMLLPGFLAIARETGLPMAISEIGSSAGLNLNFDRFGYYYGGERWGDTGSPVQLAPEVRGAPPPLGGTPDVRSRAGCDIAPVDVADDADRARLRSYIWPDQPARLQRLDGAIALATSHPFEMCRQDAADFIRRQLSARASGAAFVLFHSIMWQYMPRETKNDILAALDDAGRAATRNAPIARLRMEPLDPKDAWATLSLTMWPGGETRRLAKCDFHGRWIEWAG